MKVHYSLRNFSLCFFFLVDLSKSSYSGMSKKWSMLKRQHVTSLMIEIGGAGLTATKEQDDEVRSVLSSDLKMVNNYGCWCYFDDDILIGRGDSVDYSDTACKKMSNRMKCVIKEHPECAEGDNRPWAIDYDIKVEKGYKKMIKSCEKLNRGNICATYACLIEAQFLEEVFSLAVAVNFTDPKFLHENSMFDPVSSCKAKNEVINNAPQKGAGFGNFRSFENVNDNKILSENNYRGGSGSSGEKKQVEENQEDVLTVQTTHSEFSKFELTKLEHESRREIILAQRGISSQFYCAA